MGKYFTYAFGEIILVVIGILIALQINSWYQEYLSKKKEHTYLVELKESLEKDKQQIQNVLDFNVDKDSVVLNLMKIFDSNLTNYQRFEIIKNYATPFTHYQVFNPNSTTWNNFLSAENIDLIHEKKLRNLLTEYYSFDYKGSVQERLKRMNRKVIDDNFPSFMTKEMALITTNLHTDLPSFEELDPHLKQTFLSDLYGIRYLISEQNRGLVSFNEQIDTILALIDESTK